MASLSWKFSRDTMGYLTFSTGWMAGGYDLYSATNQGNFAYDPEYTRNYEAGIKTSFFDNRLRADFSVFYTDITDKQIREEVAGGSVGAWKITNAADAHTQGWNWNCGHCLSGIWNSLPPWDTPRPKLMTGPGP